MASTNQATAYFKSWPESELDCVDVNVKFPGQDGTELIKILFQTKDGTDVTVDEELKRILKDNGNLPVDGVTAVIILKSGEQINLTGDQYMMDFLEHLAEADSVLYLCR